MVAEDDQHRPGEGKTRVPNPEHALDHPARREILRALIDADEAKAVEDLAELLPSENVRSLNYHVLVLEREGCISRAEETALANGMPPTYVATVADNQFVMDILNGTRGEGPGRDGG